MAQHPTSQGFLKRFLRAREGATIVEFAIVAPVFFLLLLGIIEFGLFTFHKVAIESIAMQVGREATLGRANADPTCASTGNDRYDYIRCYVNRKAGGLIDGDEVLVSINPVAEGGVRAAPEICLDNPNRPSSTPLTCRSWEDTNGNGVYEGLTQVNAGEAGQLVEVRISYPWRVLVPFMNRFIGGKDNTGKDTDSVMITSSTIIKNEPFGGGS